MGLRVQASVHLLRECSRLFTIQTMCIKSEVSRRNLKWAQLPAQPAAVSSSHQCITWRSLPVKQTIMTESSSKSWSRKWLEVNSLTKHSRRRSRWSSFTNLINCHRLPKQVCAEQWRHTCQHAVLLLIVRVSPKLSCHSSLAACKSVCLHLRSKSLLSYSRKLLQRKTLSYHHKLLLQLRTTLDATSAAPLWCYRR